MIPDHLKKIRDEWVNNHSHLWPRHELSERTWDACYAEMKDQIENLREREEKLVTALIITLGALEYADDTLKDESIAFTNCFPGDGIDKDVCQTALTKARTTLEELGIRKRNE